MRHLQKPNEDVKNLPVAPTFVVIFGVLDFLLEGTSKHRCEQKSSVNQMGGSNPLDFDPRFDPDGVDLDGDLAFCSLSGLEGSMSEAAAAGDFHA